MQKIKKGDNVVVIAGRDKGKRGDVARVVDDRHVIVNGVNTVKKHVTRALAAMAGSTSVAAAPLSMRTRSRNPARLSVA